MWQSSETKQIEFHKVHGNKFERTSSCDSHSFVKSSVWWPRNILFVRLPWYFWRQRIKVDIKHAIIYFRMFIKILYRWFETSIMSCFWSFKRNKKGAIESISPITLHHFSSNEESHFSFWWSWRAILHSPKDGKFTLEPVHHWRRG